LKRVMRSMIYKHDGKGFIGSGECVKSPCKCVNVHHWLKISESRITVFPPVRLKENALDLFEFNDAGADFLVDGQGEGLEERRLSDEDQVMGRREIFAEQTEFAKRLGGHEMGIINDGDEHLAGAMDFKGFLN